MGKSRRGELPKFGELNRAVAGIVASGGFDAAHALIVRPIGERYQIVSGHNRFAAAQRSAIASVPAWVREMDDDAAYMALVTSNAQGELSSLERGMHALHSGKSVRDYAEGAGRSKSTVDRERAAAEVADNCPNVGTGLSEHFVTLVAIHAAPSWLWPALVSRMLDEALTVEATRRMVAVEVEAATVYNKVCNQLQTSQLVERTTHLAQIHAAPSWLWPSLVSRMLDKVASAVMDVHNDLSSR